MLGRPAAIYCPQQEDPDQKKPAHPQSVSPWIEAKTCAVAARRVRWRSRPPPRTEAALPPRAPPSKARNERSTQVDSARVTRLNCSGGLCVYIAEGIGLHQVTR